jgi:hypothetical protein
VTLGLFCWPWRLIVRARQGDVGVEAAEVLQMRPQPMHVQPKTRDSWRIFFKKFGSA